LEKKTVRDKGRMRGKMLRTNLHPEGETSLKGDPAKTTFRQRKYPMAEKTLSRGAWQQQTKLEIILLGGPVKECGRAERVLTQKKKEPG